MTHGSLIYQTRRQTVSWQSNRKTAQPLPLPLSPLLLSMPPGINDRFSQCDSHPPTHPSTHARSWECCHRAGAARKSQTYRCLVYMYCIPGAHTVLASQPSVTCGYGWLLVTVLFFNRSSHRVPRGFLGDSWSQRQRKEVHPGSSQIVDALGFRTVKHFLWHLGVYLTFSLDQTAAEQYEYIAHISDTNIYQIDYYYCRMSAGHRMQCGAERPAQSNDVLIELHSQWTIDNIA